MYKLGYGYDYEAELEEKEREIEGWKNDVAECQREIQRLRRVCREYEELLQERKSFGCAEMERSSK